MTVKERLIMFIKSLGIGQGAFEKEVGLSNGYVNNIRKSIQPDKIQRIARRYPELNTGWLMTGEGEMLKPDFHRIEPDEKHIGTGKVIPYYDAEAAAGASYGMNMEPARQVGVIEIGGLLKDSESALRIYGNSMTPNYPSGCVVGLRPHNDPFIEPGSVYVIETDDNRYFKRLYYNQDKTGFRCKSDNSMKYESGTMEGEYFYPDFEIPFDSVRRLLRVIGVIKRNVI